MIKKDSFIILFFLLPSCMTTQYQPPQHKMPEKFYDTCDADTNEPLTTWWEQFNDVTLNKLIQHALEYNYDLAIAVERINEARNLYQIKDAQLYPQINGISQIRHTRFSQALAQTSFLDNPNVSFFQFGFDSFWELDFWHQIRYQRDAQLYTYQAEIERMRNVYIVLIAQVVRTYIDLCAYAKIIRLLNYQIKIREKLLQLQTDLFIAGLANQIGVMQQKQLLIATENKQEQFIILLQQTKNQLAILLGLNPTQLKIHQLRQSVPLSFYRIETGIPSTLLQRRPDIRQAERKIAAAHATLNAAITDWFPRVTLFGGLSSESSNGSGWFTGKSLSWFIGPNIRWPIITFGRVQANIHVQASRERQEILDYSNVVINALKDVEDFLIAYCHNKEQITLLLAKYRAAKKEERLTQNLFHSGLRNEQDYLNAKLNKINVAIALTQTQQALSLNLASLYKALGGGW